MANREQIAQQALGLPEEDRAYVADLLEQSLASVGFANAEIAAAWASEVERRLEAYDRGDVQAVAADVSLERMRRYLAEHRARKAAQ
jgi:hypothetical protein